MPLPKKRADRKLLSRHAWITLDGGFAARRCLVQDISASGAKITMDDDASQLPGVIRMAFSRDARTGRSCQVVWRRGKSAGIKFL
ncbi:PilZ domain-containing protein [Bradyrhizobium hipponense]|uniref:PilZ domain-containing protein n=1 Tax=Bradyrhizobium hipponense TaxID=2605638 RepID=A0A5S4YSZ8_9BRAD|nr:PilZ domain-containing protein [Bradyrhizobium hipponense]TYO67258.1 PilZ domain-containing protein [Bradyrhizobium hipponense]